jgi:hypothetical protein
MAQLSIDIVKQDGEWVFGRVAANKRIYRAGAGMAVHERLPHAELVQVIFEKAIYYRFVIHWITSFLLCVAFHYIISAGVRFVPPIRGGGMKMPVVENARHFYVFHP